MAAAGSNLAGSIFGQDGVVRRALRTIRSHLWVMMIGVILLIGLPVGSLNWAASHLTAAVFPGRGLRSALGSLAISTLQSAIQSAAGAWYTAWVTLLLEQDAKSGGKADPAEAFTQVVRRAWPLVGVAVLMLIGVMLGTILLVFPALFAMTVWAVATPALVSENLSPTKALARSVELTRGSRGTIFELAMLFLLVVLGLQTLAAKLVTHGEPLKVALATPVMRFVLQPLLQSLEFLFLSAGVASIYVELVRLKSGQSQE